MCLLIKYNKTLQISYAPFPSLPAVVILIQQIICFREIALSFIFRTDFSRISSNCVLDFKASAISSCPYYHCAVLVNVL